MSVTWSRWSGSPALLRVDHVRPRSSFQGTAGRGHLQRACRNGLTASAGTPLTAGMKRNLDPIGTVKSPVTEAVDENWGEVQSEIHLAHALVPGLKGIEQFSHIIVVFIMHESTFDPQRDLVRRPRGRADMPEVGIFAQRAKHRPNPIGITTVRLIQVQGNLLTVQGLDAIEGTPVLDIKPYWPAFDSGPNRETPGWVAD